jgi:hypothetical protein
LLLHGPRSWSWIVLILSRKVSRFRLRLVFESWYLLLMPKKRV